MRIKIITLLIFLSMGFIFPINPAYGQDEPNNVDMQLWMDYNPTYVLSKKWLLVGDIGIRGLISNQDWNQILVRPTFRYVIHESFNLQASPALFSTFNKDFSNIHELRFTFDLNADGPDLLYVLPFYRIRFEQRNFYYTDPDIENNSTWRGRALIGLESLDLKAFKEGRFFYFQAIYEGFLTLGKESATETFINQTRIHAAFGHKLSKKVRYEIHYIWQASRQYVDDGLQTSQNVLRFRFYHRIGQRKKKEQISN